MVKVSLLKSLLAAAAPIVVAGALTAADPAVAAENSVVVARAMDLNSLDPARGYCDTCQIYLSAVYDTLLTLGPDNKTIAPDLAQS
jgi:peptide/nickel transport system substrate-binding protein